MAVRLEVPGMVADEVRAALDQSGIGYSQQLLKSAGWPAIFVLVSAGLSGLDAAFSLIDRIVRNHHEPKAPSWLAGIVSDDAVKEATITLQNGRVIRLSDNPKAAAAEVFNELGSTSSDNSSFDADA